MASHGAGKTVSRAAYGAGARGDITGPRRNTQSPRFLKVTPFEQGNTKRVETKSQSDERIRRGEEVRGWGRRRVMGGGWRDESGTPTEAKRNLLSQRARTGGQIDTAASKREDASPTFLPSYTSFVCILMRRSPPPLPLHYPRACIHTRTGHVNVNMRSQGPKY